MTVLDDRLIPRILAIVQRLGKLVVFTVAATESYNPDTGEATRATAASYSLKVTPPEVYEEGLIDGENIRRGDMRVWLPASGLAFTPSPTVTVTIDGATWAVVDVAPVYTGEQVALYGLQLRK